jgi:hypothetical protein
MLGLRVVEPDEEEGQEVRRSPEDAISSDQYENTHIFKSDTLSPFRGRFSTESQVERRTLLNILVCPKKISFGLIRSGVEIRYFIRPYISREKSSTQHPWGQIKLFSNRFIYSNTYTWRPTGISSWHDTKPENVSIMVALMEFWNRSPINGNG